MRRQILYFTLILFLTTVEGFTANSCWNIMGRSWKEPMFFNHQTAVDWANLCRDSGYGHAFSSKKFKVDVSSNSGCDGGVSTCIPYWTEDTRDHVKTLFDFMGNAVGSKESLDSFYSGLSGIADGLYFAAGASGKIPSGGVGFLIKSALYLGKKGLENQINKEQAIIDGEITDFTTAFYDKLIKAPLG